MEYPVRQSQYYLWHASFPPKPAKAFGVHQQIHLEQRIRKDNVRLKGLVGEWTSELKTKTSYWTAKTNGVAGSVKGQVSVHSCRKRGKFF